MLAPGWSTLSLWNRTQRVLRAQRYRTSHATRVDISLELSTRWCWLVSTRFNGITALAILKIYTASILQPVADRTTTVLASSRYLLSYDSQRLWRRFNGFKACLLKNQTNHPPVTDRIRRLHMPIDLRSTSLMIGLLVGCFWVYTQYGSPALSISKKPTLSPHCGSNTKSVPFWAITDFQLTSLAIGLLVGCCF